MALPPGIAPRRDRTSRQTALDKIAREADRQRRDLKLPPGAKLGRKPGFLLMAMLGLAAIGGALVTASREGTARRLPALRVDTAFNELGVLATALGLYRIHVGHYPTIAEGELAALVADPGQTGWAGPYITKLAPDPWGRPYRYTPSTTPASLFSHGPDRAAGTADDLQAEPADFEVDAATAAEWTREEPRRPTVEIGALPPSTPLSPPSHQEETP